MEQYFDENGRHYFTEEELEALKQLRDHLMQSYREFWEEQEANRNEQEQG